ncbi:MAG: hypothetical protein ACXWHG_12990 [Thermoanaerobaculia bacterium]
MLRDDGVLRLSTPNLDWVWASHYRRVLTSDQEILGAFGLNRAFRGWGHRFLFNFGTLAATLRDAASRTSCAPGTARVRIPNCATSSGTRRATTSKGSRIF